jgi:histidyl-tRNA synthetase
MRRPAAGYPYLDGQGFELRCLELGAQQQVAGGGAYREGAGFAIGAERLLLALKAQGIEHCS